MSIILIKQPYNTGIAIICHLELYISSHAVSTFWQFRYMKNTTTTITISHPRKPVPNLSVCSFHQRSDCLRLNPRLQNSALWVPSTQKWVHFTGYVEPINDARYWRCSRGGGDRINNTLGRGPAINEDSHVSHISLFPAKYNKQCIAIRTEAPGHKIFKFSNFQNWGLLPNFVSHYTTNFRILRPWAQSKHSGFINKQN